MKHKSWIFKDAFLQRFASLLVLLDGELDTERYQGLLIIFKLPQTKFDLILVTRWQVDKWWSQWTISVLNEILELYLALEECSWRWGPSNTDSWEWFILVLAIVLTLAHLTNWNHRWTTRSAWFLLEWEFRVIKVGELILSDNRNFKGYITFKILEFIRYHQLPY